MTTRTKIEATAAGIVLLAVFCGALAWHAYEVKLAQTEERTQQLQRLIDQDRKVIEQNQKAIADNQQTIQNRDAALDKTTAMMQRQMDTIKTMAQAQGVLQGITKDAPRTVRAEDLPESVRKTLPNSPSFNIYSEQESVRLAQFKVQCDINSERLKVCTLDKTTLQDSLTKSQDATAKAQDSQKQSQQQAEDWKKLAKGGSWIKRGLHDAGRMMIGGLIVYGLQQARKK